MTRKKRRGRRQHSLPLESARTIDAIRGADGALPAAAASERDQSDRRQGNTRRNDATAASGSALSGVDAPVTREPGMSSIEPAFDSGEPQHRESDTAAARGQAATEQAGFSSASDDALAAVGDASTVAAERALDAVHSTPVTSVAPTAVILGADIAVGDVGSLGARLRAAREARGLTREALAILARIPLSVIGRLEAGDLASLGAPIYVRGFLRSYARAVGVPEVVVEAAMRDVRIEEPVLVVNDAASVGDRFAARYKNPLVYALLTLVVVVPLVFLATPQSSRDAGPAFAPLDVELPASNRATAAGGPVPDAPDASAAPAPAALPPAPVMASMAPIPSPLVPPRPIGASVLTLRVSEPSWIELTGTDGRRLEYAQLQPGTVREYVLDGGADLVVGNVPGVVATLNGRPIDLNAVANRNVARLRVGDASAAAGQ